jgi:hypothetical protein
MSKINNYEELILERKKLEAELLHHKSVINDEVALLKHKMEPITNVVSFFTPAKNSSNNNSLLQAGTNIGIELLVRQKLLSKAGWLTKLVVPFLLKKISSKAIERAQEAKYIRF